MKVSRLVIDTNVWIAALISPTGVARRVVDSVVARGIAVEIIWYRDLPLKKSDATTLVATKALPSIEH
jgi:hypothetical protein